MADLVGRGVEFSYEPDRFSFIQHLTTSYTPDFRLPNGIYVEAKGKLDRLARRRYEAFKSVYPGIDVRFLFMQDNPLQKGAKMRYSGWATKHGFTFAVSKNGVIPEEWLK